LLDYELTDADTQLLRIAGDDQKQVGIVHGNDEEFEDDLVPIRNDEGHDYKIWLIWNRAKEWNKKRKGKKIR